MAQADRERRFRRRGRSGRSGSSRTGRRPSGTCSSPGTPSRSAAASAGRRRQPRARSGCGSRTPRGALSAYAAVNSFSRHEKIELACIFPPSRSMWHALRPGRALGSRFGELLLECAPARTPRCAVGRCRWRRGRCAKNTRGSLKPARTVCSIWSSVSVRPATRCGSRSKAPGIWRMLFAGYSADRPAIG